MPMVYITYSNATFVQSYIIIAVVLEIYRITLRVQAYRTKSVCENPYDTSKYLVL